MTNDNPVPTMLKLCLDLSAVEDRGCVSHKKTPEAAASLTNFNFLYVCILTKQAKHQAFGPAS